MKRNRDNDQEESMAFDEKAEHEIYRKQDLDLEIMKLAVDSEVRRAGAANDIYDRQRTINTAIAMGVSRIDDEGMNTDHLLTLEAAAMEDLGYDL